jgi:hypothetical protein
MNVLNKRLLMASGTALVLASLMVFGLGTPGTTIGNETDVGPGPGEPKNLEIAVQDSTPNAEANINVTVFVTDVLGSSVVGAECTFAIASQPGTDATVDPGPVTSDSGGRVDTTLYTGSTSGTIELEVSCGDVSDTVTLDVGGLGPESGGGNTGGEATEPPASFPESGTGGFVGTDSAKTMLIALLAGVGLVLAGAGFVSGRIGERVRSK